jgi:CDP-2,3-bis-(O-geranylgeranyl)-sn-glycerol synthase
MLFAPLGRSLIYVNLTDRMAPYSRRGLHNRYCRRTIMRPTIELLYLLLPAFLANMAPPFVKYWPGWNRPINERWLGAHKTVIGFAFGVVAAIITVFCQSRFPWSGTLISYADWPLLGLAIGFGAMSGDAVKSLLKRRIGIAPGQSWIPADQLDYVLGALVCLWPWIRLGWQEVLLVCVISFAGHILVNHLAYWLGIRDTKW